MRILQIMNRLPYPPRDGGAIAMFNMMKGFVELGHEVHLLCLNTRKHFIELSTLPSIFKRLASLQAIPIDTTVTAWGALSNLLSSRSYNISRFYSHDFEKALIAKLRSQPFDIIHIEGLHMCLYLGTIRKYSSSPAIVRAHNVEYLIWDRMAKSQQAGIKRWYLQLLARRMKRFELKVLNRLDAVVAITETDERLFHEHGCTVPIHVAPTGLDLDEYIIRRDQIEWPSVFHLGALDWLPNQQAVQWFLDEIWPHVHLKFPKLKFYLAGRHMPEWLKLRQDAGLEIAGEVEDAKRFINSKAMMVVPLQSGSGMRIKIIEGMALGKAIVTTSIGAEGINCVHGQEVLIADTAESFTRQLSKCVLDYDLCERLGNNARVLVEQDYDNLAITRKLTEFYSTLLQ